MKRVIGWVRTSTDKQELDDQKKELAEFLATEGYKEDEIEWISKKGASAAKMDDEYQAMVESMKQTVIENPQIEAVAVWHLNRAFRTEKAYIDIKEFLVSNGVNLISKNPYVKLLTPTGEVDKGMELAAGLLTLLAKQDQEERKAKFRRAKKANAAKGKYNGGFVKTGYVIDENGYLKPDEKQAKLINQIFTLYATGKYSMRGLAKELSELGITYEDGKQITPDALLRILADTAYIGYTDDDVKRSHRKYIPIVSQELWDKVVKVRKANMMDIPKTRTINLANKILKCPVCGGNLHRVGKHYICWRHDSYSSAAVKGHHCTYELNIPVTPTHSILWEIASHFHVEHLLKDSVKDIGKYKAKLNDLDKKISTIQGKIDTLITKRDKTIDSYIDGWIDKTKRDEKLSQINSDEQELSLRLKDLKAEHKQLVQLVKKLSNPSVYSEEIVNTMTDVFRERDLKRMYDIIHTYIKRCTAVRTQFGKPDRRSSKPNALEYRIDTIDGYTYRMLYIPCSHRSKYYAWNGKEFEPMMLDIID